MATMKKITFYTNFLRRSTKLVCLLACAVLCCASSAQEIDFQDKVAKPYIIAYNNRKYQFCPVDLNILKCEKFADICESFFNFIFSLAPGRTLRRHLENHSLSAVVMLLFSAIPLYL